MSDSVSAVLFLIFLCLIGKDALINILAVADAMEARGWKMERQQRPSCLHFSVMPHHEGLVDSLIADLREVEIFTSSL